MAESVTITGAGLKVPLPGLLTRPAGARAVLALAHGAGAGMRHAWMEKIASALAAEGIATLRYDFPYMAAGGKRPDPPRIATAAVRAAVATAQSIAGGLPVLAGGKSFGGRMSSTAQSEAPLPGVPGLVFFGFPLHPAGKPALDRAAHLEAVRIPMLFLSGTRDELCDLALLREATDPLQPLAEVELVDGADHGFAVLKSSGRTAADVLAQLARSTAAFAARLGAARTP
jgi:predicted alpha/beta-hydrolase family hydrolase